MFRYYRFKYHNTSRQGWREEEVEKEEEGEPKQTAHVHTHRLLTIVPHSVTLSFATCFTAT